MSRVVVPPSAGLFSSFGLLYADVEHHYSRTFRRLLRQADLGRDRARLERRWPTRRGRSSRPRTFARRPHAAAPLGGAALPGPELRAHRAGAGRADRRAHGRRMLEEAFGQEHERTYGHRAGADEPVELVSIQIVGQGLRQGAGVPERLKPSRAEPQPPPPRRAYFGDARAGSRRRSCAAPTSRAPQRAADRRGIRRDLRRAARRHRQPRCRRQYRHRLGLERSVWSK